MALIVVIVSYSLKQLRRNHLPLSWLHGAFLHHPSLLHPPQVRVHSSQHPQHHWDRGLLDWVPLLSRAHCSYYSAGLLVSPSYLSQVSSGMFWAIINLNQLIFFSPLMNLKLPRIIFVVFRILSFTVGDIYVLKLLFSVTLGQFLDKPDFNPFSSNFLQAGISC